MTKLGARSGFALLAILWVLTGASALAIAAMELGRDAFATSRNRVFDIRAKWASESCLSLARAAIANVLLQQPRSESIAVLWTGLDRLAAATAPLLGSGCAVSFDALGNAIDVNVASQEQLEALFANLGFKNNASLAAALLDWRDQDSVPRPLGAEYDWYVANHRPGPRNSPFADIREIRLVRGFETLELEGTLAVDSARISFNTAPAAVLTTIPGITAAAADRVAQLRDAGTPVTDLASFAAGLPSDARDSMYLHFEDVSRSTALEPDGWFLTTTAQIGSPPVAHTVQVLLTRADTRAAIVRRQEW